MKRSIWRTMRSRGAKACKTGCECRGRGLEIIQIDMTILDVSIDSVPEPHGVIVQHASGIVTRIYYLSPALSVAKWRRPMRRVRVCWKDAMEALRQCAQAFGTSA